MRYVCYNANCLARYQDLPGIKEFLFYFRAYEDPNMSPVDRTGVIKFPVRTKSLCPLPQLRLFMPTYEEVCNERAQELLARAEKLDTSLYVFWSGGIDSTCVLVSLLKNAFVAQRERIVVVMSEDSIAEYPAFYHQHIRGKLRRESAMMFPYIIGTHRVLVSGENNDQLFGSDIIASVINRFGFDAVLEPYNRELFMVFFTTEMGEHAARLYVRLFEELKERAPVVLKTNYDVFWWINFAVKWQTAYMRMLSFTAKRNVHLLSEHYVKTYYAPFYSTESFQLWSLSNPRQRVRDGWRSYKWPAKEIIYEYTKDADYRDNKLKRGSLQYLAVKHIPFIIDENFKCHESITPEEFYVEDNDFIRLRASTC
jgi:hypothetical protein